ncbi:MAG: hypothetical protein RJA07_2786 [Bacteroidota bacterium]|jgi:hypothetical protein
MQKKLVLIVLLGLSQFVEAQTYHAISFDYSSKIDYYDLSSITTDTNSNTYISGFFNGVFSLGGISIYSGNSSTLNHTMYLAKLNNQSKVIWLKKITEFEFMSGYSPRNRIQCDKKNNLLLEFDFTDSIIVFNKSYYSLGSSDGILFKLDSSGNYIWHTTIRGSYGDGFNAGRIGIDSNNNIIVSGGFGGYSGSPPPIAFANFGGITLTTQGADGFIAKYNENGNILWVRRGGSSNLDDGYNGSLIDVESNIYSLMQLSPSSLIYFDSINSYLYPQNASSVATLVKYSKQGQYLWARSLLGITFPNIVYNYNFSILKNQNIIVAGSYNSFNSIQIEGYSTFPPNITGTGGTNEYLSFLVCYDSLGNVLWAKNPHKLLGGTEHPIGVVSSKTNSDFFFVSYFDNAAIISGNDTVYGTGYQNVLIECMDSIGNKKWHKIIKSFPGANACDMAINDNNEIIIVGNTSSSTLQCDAKKVNISSTPAMYILKLAPGDVNWNDTLNGFEDVVANKDQLVVYPNPTNEWLTINDKWLTINTIEITDMLGRVMVSLSNHINQQIKNSSTQPLQIDVSTLPNGIYFIKTIDVKGNQLNAKFVKE